MGLRGPGRLRAGRRDRSFNVGNQHTPSGRKDAKGGGTLRRRPPCRNFGGDARSQELAGQIVAARWDLSLHREQLADIAEFDRAEGWRGDGAVSMIAWVTGQCGVSTSTARQWVRAAENLESLPCLAEGLASGTLSLDLVEPLAEVASPSNDAALREASAHWSVRQARELVAWHRAQAEAQSALESEGHPGQPQAHVAADGDEAAHERAADHQSPAAREFDRRTLRFNDTRRLVCALHQGRLCGGEVSARGQHPTRRESASTRRSGGRPRIRSDTPRMTSACTTRSWICSGRVVNHLNHLDQVEQVEQVEQVDQLDQVDQVQGVGRRAAPGSGPCAARAARRWFESRRGGIAGVGPVQVEVVRRLACDANVDLAVEGRGGSILDQGRARRDPTPVQRIEIDRRDKGCRFPGCSYTEFTNVHHMVHWVDGGLTNLANLVTLCGRHHRAVHELGWAMSGNADEAVTFTSPHGRSAKSVPSPTWRMSAVDRNAPMRR